MFCNLNRKYKVKIWFYVIHRDHSNRLLCREFKEITVFIPYWRFVWWSIFRVIECTLFDIWYFDFVIKDILFIVVSNNEKVIL